LLKHVEIAAQMAVINSLNLSSDKPENNQGLGKFNQRLSPKSLASLTN
jgi:hypothetical protein